MPDSVRMIDLGALSRGLESFRRVDPEQRVLSQRLGVRAALQRVEETHRDVTESDQTSGAAVREHEEDEAGRKDSGEPAGQEDGEESELALPPEVDEGHLLNIRV